jgi:ankyrin repeat protein
VHTALTQAIITGDLDEVRRNIRSGIAADARRHVGMTALELAIEHMHVEVARYLLEVGASVNSCNEYGQTPLHGAVDIEIEAAIQQSDREGWSVPMTTALTSLLLQHGADPTLKDKAGESPLDWARQRNHVAAVALMTEAIEQRADDRR